MIVTAGGTPIKLGVPGELEYAGQGVSYCAVCDGAFFKGETIAVVGGGDAAVEEADYLTRYAAKVYLDPPPRRVPRVEDPAGAAVREPQDRGHLEHAVAGADGRRRAGLTGSSWKTRSPASVSRSAATGCFVFIGFRPNTGLIKGHFEHDASGYSSPTTG